MYLCTRTRPIYWVALKRVLRYLKGTEEYGIHFAPTDSILSCHSDSDWAGSADWSSVSGDVISIGGPLVSWRTSKQKCTALSTTEAEYVSLSEASREVVWLRNLLTEMG